MERFYTYTRFGIPKIFANHDSLNNFKTKTSLIVEHSMKHFKNIHQQYTFHVNDHEEVAGTNAHLFVYHSNIDKQLKFNVKIYYVPGNMYEPGNMVQEKT